jgi:divalent metal cation (Fe/Co/Zn/Cd) transporter
MSGRPVFARKTGLQYHIDLHIEVDPTLTVAASHALGGHIRATLKRDQPGWLTSSSTPLNRG